MLTHEIDAEVGSCRRAVLLAGSRAVSGTCLLVLACSGGVVLAHMFAGT